VSFVYINRLNSESDYILTFTPYWEDIAKGLGITKPTGFLQHGFNPMIHYPVPSNICRDYYNLKHEDFIVLSLNRNQPRKRYDILLQAWATFVAKHINDPVKLLIATAIQGGWNLLEVYERELWKHKLTLEQGLKHVIFIDNPQQLLDDEINILYNVGDISISCADGGGMELCTYQQAGIGKAQITSYVGGIKDFFTEENSMILKPVITFYIDSARDGCGGEAELVNYMDAVDALEKYYSDANLRKKHGEICRKEINEKYKWCDLGKKFYEIIKEVNSYPTGVHFNSSTTSSSETNKIKISDIKEDIDEELIAKPSEEVVAKPSEEVVAKPAEEVVAKSDEEVVAKPSE
jgi:glycosyltransferase involved in cell wall biosynthesis